MESNLLFKRLTSFHEPELREEIVRNGKVISAKKGDVLIKEGQYLDFLPIVIKGSIRVFRKRDDREILLYYVGPQETCVMSLSSAYFDYNSAANGMATESTDILVLPAKVIADWQLKYPSWNRFIMNTFKNRYDELLQAFGKAVFDPIPIRLREYLLKVASYSPERAIRQSHQSLANELGTTRVVVSRILKQFESEKFVKLDRGLIKVK
jgi:CRP/FNR family transcriptional regulator